MTEVLTSAQMRAIEQAAIDSGEVAGLELMERAGKGVVAAVLAEWPDLAEGAHRAVVLCGPGNNGGDGFVVARLFEERGWDVRVLVLVLGDLARQPPDARANADRWQARQTLAHVGSEWDAAFAHALDVALFEGMCRSVVLVDALFGTGLSRAPLEAMWLFQDLPHPAEVAAEFGMVLRRVAVDLPTGVCADSGRVLVPEQPGTAPARWFEADLTVTFHSLKPGHLLAEGPGACGKVAVVDIGLAQGRGGLMMVAPPLPGHLVKPGGHKFTHGHALILSGAPGQGGAARLAGRGALRIGAGLVTLGCPPDAMAENAARLDAVMLRAVADGAMLAMALADPRINALCLGPGLGTGPREAELLAVALRAPVPGPTRDLGSPVEDGGEGGPGARAAGGAALPAPGLTRDLGSSRDEGETSGPGSSPGRVLLSGRRQVAASSPVQAPGTSPGRGLVLDADALAILARLPDLFATLHARCVLTPHAGEFARLFPDLAAKLAEPATTGPAYSKVDATRAAAARAGCVVLFKGPDTVIADPSGRCAINAAHYDRAAPWLATAGSGDVLAGFITGLLARGFTPFDAACTAAWLHVEAARSFGPGLIAEDLPEELPKVFRGLGL